MSKSPGDTDSWCKEAVPIGAILLCFDLAWSVQLATLSNTDLTVAPTAALQSIFIASSALLGAAALLHFCVLQVRQFHVHQVTCENTEEKPQPVSQAVDIKVIAIKQSFEEEGPVVAKQADL